MPRLNWQPDAVRGNGCQIVVHRNGLGCATVEVLSPGFGTLTFAVAGAALKAFVADLAAIVDHNPPQTGVSGNGKRRAPGNDDPSHESAPGALRLTTVAGTLSTDSRSESQATA